MTAQKHEDLPDEITNIARYDFDMQKLEDKKAENEDQRQKQHVSQCVGCIAQGLRVNLTSVGQSVVHNVELI